MPSGVQIEEWEDRTGWAVISGADDYEPNVRAFFPEFEQAAAYISWCQSTEPCIVAALLTDGGIALANHVDYGLGAEALVERYMISEPEGPDFIRSGRKAMQWQRGRHR